MRPRRASLLPKQEGVAGIEVNPYISYTRPSVDQEPLAALRRPLARVLLLIPPYSTAQLTS